LKANKKTATENVDSGHKRGDLKIPNRKKDLKEASHDRPYDYNVYPE
jgi:hypothetical protein